MLDSHELDTSKHCDTFTLAIWTKIKWNLYPAGTSVYAYYLCCKQYKTSLPSTYQRLLTQSVPTFKYYNFDPLKSVVNI